MPEETGLWISNMLFSIILRYFQVAIRRPFLIEGQIISVLAVTSPQLTNLLCGKRYANHYHLVDVVKNLWKICMEEAYTPKKKGVIKIK